LAAPAAGFAPRPAGFARAGLAAPGGAGQHRRTMTSALRQRLAEASLRLLLPAVLAGVAALTFWLASLFDEPPGFSPASAGVLLGIVLLISESVRAVALALGRRLPWRDGVLRRGLAQLGATALLAVLVALVIYVPLKLWEIRQGSHDELAWPHLLLTAAFAFGFALAFNALHAVVDFYRGWQQARGEAEALRAVALKAELEALKAQVNPHFLFNSLNAVYGLIDEDPRRARGLVLELSDVFRYVLSHGNRDLVPLAQELEFLDAFEALLAARHGDGLRIERATGGGEQQVALPPMTLQLLVENAVKHNRIEPGDGLVVRIERDGDTLEVSNPLKPRRGATAGAGTGLRNIDQRYRLLHLRGVDVRRDADRFLVRVPLLPCSP